MPSKPVWQLAHSSSPYIVLGVLFVYHTTVLWSMFGAGNFGYHDLTLINDWFTNAIYLGKPFYITDYDSNHLSYNFTPTLVILIPFYYLTQSQFILVLLGTSALYVSLAFLIELFKAVAKPAASPLLIDFMAVSIVVLCCQNEYTKLVLTSAHFEVLFLLPAIALAFVLVTRDKPSWILILMLTVLAVGVRQDAGLYLAFILTGLFFVKPQIDRTFTIRIVCLVLFSLGYVLVATLLIMPALGYSGGLRFWKHLGDSPVDILISLVLNPGRTWLELKYSAFIPINRSFNCLHLFNPFAIFANLPVLPMYFVKTADFGRKYLLLYNASFPLAGFYIALCAGLSTALRLLARVRNKPWFFRFGQSVLVLVLLYSMHGLYRNRYRIPPAKNSYKYQLENRLADFRVSYARMLQVCPRVNSLATDFHTLTFLPNRKQKYLWHNFKRADAVIVDLHPRPDTPGLRKPLEFTREVKGAGYREAFRDRKYVLLIGPRMQCSS